MMTDLMTAHARGRAKRAALVATSIGLTAVLLLWAWNTVAVGLAGLPAAEFRHALAPVLALAGLFYLARKA